MRRADLNRRILVLIPTFNEALTIRSAVVSVRAALPDAEVLVIDDGSPDGTGEIVEQLARLDRNIHVLHRSAKAGLGAAYLAGFAWGLDRDFDILVEMDADGSHPSSRLSALTEAIAEGSTGLVIGSRWTPGGSVVNWPRSREFLSRSGNSYARWMLRFGVRDSTSGFRAFRSDVLRAIPLQEVGSRGYFFQVDMTLRVHDAGFGILEVPIEFRDREHGESKMSLAIVIEAMARVTLTGLARRLGHPRR